MIRTTFGRTPNRVVYPAKLAMLLTSNGAKTWEASLYGMRAESIRGPVASTAKMLEECKKDFGSLAHHLCGHSV